MYKLFILEIPKINRPKCSYCKNEIRLDDFFIVSKKETEKGKIKIKVEDFKGENIRVHLRNFFRMWVCPVCYTILGFSERDSDHT
ncbi:MAG: hypothetical protein ACFFDN_44515 [Candidatus Hodarchaeota archaeon]